MLEIINISKNLTPVIRTHFSLRFLLCIIITKSMKKISHANEDTRIIVIITVLKLLNDLQFKYLMSIVLFSGVHSLNSKIIFFLLLQSGIKDIFTLLLVSLINSSNFLSSS
ncbi:hypothetical protein BCR36DRAFT_371065 [Piromyces finnis]|uniref:Uncharacterized protein n=1 Tax=Piromyces finnis TaxID=1754191 RepID=A0A1Y1V9A4_9FUNG|nr:hypothetical protein BCR36DRAFT_371065 [Piromyces finnis]|eukprot:ORX49002.1 hypothetical protein BCR36DRAFT_371065 [Piromyces finnis]